MNKNLSRRLLDKLTGNGKSSVDEEQLRSIAQNVNKNDFEDETKLRQLLRTLATMSGKTLTEEKEAKIIEMFKNKEIDPNNLQSISKFLR
ncbi:stage VI sporulation protein F [Brevibacillus ginsengisoli]|uniref:stage VI sporulation protein F n=1 Tax=Brevibacillus ginsengisoli TaxID=363854 RepID=UPI003CEB6CC2